MAKQARPTANLAPKLTVVRLSVITRARLSTFAGAHVLRVPDNKYTIDKICLDLAMSIPYSLVLILRCLSRAIHITDALNAFPRIAYGNVRVLGIYSNKFC